MASATKSVPVIELNGITKDYEELRALTNINISCMPGQIHAIVGEHGAGKSSLAMILSGLISPQSGTILVNGNAVSPYTLKTAQKAGIRMIYQQSYLNDYFSVAENLFYATGSRSSHIFYSIKRVVEHAQHYLEENDIDIDPKVELRYLSLSDRTVIEIMKNLYLEPNVLILDEALEKLSYVSYTKIIPLIQKVVRRGGSVITITHRIDDVYSFADTVSVIKNGHLLLTEQVDNISKINLIRMAYTQVRLEDSQSRPDTEFYQFLKYNEAILQHLPVNIIVVDENLLIKMVNEQCVKNFALDAQRNTNTKLDRMLFSNKTALKLIKQSIEDSDAKTFYGVELTIKGKHSINNIKTNPVFDGYSVIGTIIIIEDMTEYDKLQKQLILSEKLASVGLLAAGVAHEINNPLEIISNYLSYIKYRFEGKEISDSIDNVNREIENIARIVSNLVTFSDNPETGTEVVDINKVISDILELLRYNADLKHIHVDFTHEQEQQLFQGSSGQLKQVILNLLKNSFEVMTNGGGVSIKTLSGSLKGMICSKIIVEDTGPGIPADTIDHIFLPFYSTKSGKGSQLGLGLSISYRIIESFGGEMHVNNLPGSGCQFIIDLPTGGNTAKL